MSLSNYLMTNKGPKRHLVCSTKYNSAQSVPVHLIYLGLSGNSIAREVAINNQNDQQAKQENRTILQTGKLSYPVVCDLKCMEYIIKS